MTKARLEMAVYGLLAAGSLVGTWTYNLRLLAAGGSLTDFFRQAYANNAVASLSTDIFLCAVLLIPWMLREAKRYGIKHAWAYALGSVVIAISAVLPLFLIARRRAANARGDVRGPTLLTAAYPLVSGVGFVLVNLFVLRFAQEGLPWRLFVESWFASPGAGSLGVDLLGLSATLLVFLIAEARRGHVRRVALYVAMCAFGVAFALPWFLRALDQKTGS